MNQRFENAVANINRIITEKFAAWLIYPMIFIMVIEVFARRIFAKPTFFAYDLTWILYSALAILGGGYTLIENGHVKADVFYDMASIRIKRIIDLVCYIIFFFPGMIGIVYASWNMLHKAIIFNEKTIFTNWSPSAIPSKFLLLIGMIILLAQGCVEFIQVIKALSRKGDNKQ